MENNMKGYMYIKAKKEALQAKEDYYKALLEEIKIERNILSLFKPESYEHYPNMDAMIAAARNSKSYYKRKIQEF